MRSATSIRGLLGRRQGNVRRRLPLAPLELPVLMPEQKPQMPDETLQLLERLADSLSQVQQARPVYVPPPAPPTQVFERPSRGFD